VVMLLAAAVTSFLVLEYTVRRWQWMVFQASKRVLIKIRRW
jgi:hypothetical protein